MGEREVEDGWGVVDAVMGRGGARRAGMMYISSALVYCQ